MCLREELNSLIPNYEETVSDPFVAIPSQAANCLALATIAATLEPRLLIVRHTVTGIYDHFLAFDPETNTVFDTVAGPKPQAREIPHTEYGPIFYDGGEKGKETMRLQRVGMEVISSDPEGFDRVKFSIDTKRRMYFTRIDPEDVLSEVHLGLEDVNNLRELAQQSLEERLEVCYTN